jgi:hypothetical protein
LTPPEVALRVSDIYTLSRTQDQLDFVDVDTERDVPLFIDPAVLTNSSDAWAAGCASSVQSYFQRVLDYIKAGDSIGARRLLSRLGEDNSTHLGYSSRSKGSGIGPGLAEKFYHEISSSAAVQSGLITDLEDTALLIEGIGEDRISDVTTNIIRKELVEYTQAACRYYGMKMVNGVAIGPLWDSTAGVWYQEAVELPTPSGRPLILVPKFIVRKKLHCDPDEYYRHYILEHFRDEEIRNMSSLTFVSKAQVRVKKKDVEDKYRRKHDNATPGIMKRVNLDGSLSDPTLLARFKQDKGQLNPKPMGHVELADSVGVADLPDFDTLLQKVLATPKGKKSAGLYERNVESLLTALLYPHLVHPVRQSRLHGGLKILDINYTNVARSGFFGWLSQHFPAANIVVECKNYTDDLGNPEYDQLSGRFSPSRGQYGLLVFRSCEDKAKLIASCKATSADRRGYITALDDSDLKTLVKEAESGDCTALGGLLHERFKQLV